MVSKTSSLLKTIGLTVAMGATLLSASALASKERHPAMTGTNDPTHTAAATSPATLHHWPDARFADLDPYTLHHWPTLSDLSAGTQDSTPRQANAAIATVADLDPSTLHHWP